jgi:hypothetical protein
MVVPTYADGPTLICNAPFVYEGGQWRRRFGREGYDLLMPVLTYRQFLAAQRWPQCRSHAGIVKAR